MGGSVEFEGVKHGVILMKLTGGFSCGDGRFVVMEVWQTGWAQLDFLVVETKARWHYRLGCGGDDGRRRPVALFWVWRV